MSAYAPEGSADRLPHASVRPVDDYPSAVFHKDPLLYPGARPETDYITDGNYVYTIEATERDGLLSWVMTNEHGESIEVDEFLVRQNAPTMEDRIPVLAFGSNACPGALAKKFEKIGRPDARIVPTAFASLKGHDVVWSGGPGMNGNFIAILYSGEEVADTEVGVGVNFLTREQLLVMHATEMAYDISSVDLDIQGASIRAYFYSGKDSVYLENGKPIAVESIPAANRSLADASTPEMIERILADKELIRAVIAEHPDLADVTDARTYVDYVRDLLPARGKGARMALKRLMHSELRAAGRSVIHESDASTARYESWANPSTLLTLGDQQNGLAHHHVYRLPEQELPVGTWVDAEKRRKALGAISTHYVRMRPELEEK